MSVEQIPSLYATNCFVCLNKISDSKSYVLSKFKTRLETLLSDKVLEIAKDNFIEVTVLDGIDEVCQKCYNQVNTIERLERQLSKLKTVFSVNLRRNYGKAALHVYTAENKKKQLVDDADSDVSDTFKDNEDSDYEPDGFQDTERDSDYEPQQKIIIPTQIPTKITTNSKNTSKSKILSSHRKQSLRNQISEKCSVQIPSFVEVCVVKQSLKRKKVVSSDERPGKRSRKPVKRYIELSEQELESTKKSINTSTHPTNLQNLEVDATKRKPVVMLERLNFDKHERRAPIPIPEQIKIYPSQKRNVKKSTVEVLSRTYSCLDCSVDYKTYLNYVNHLSEGFCPERSKREAEKKCTVNLKQNGGNLSVSYICTVEDCKKEFSSLKEYQSHILIHPESNKFTCFISNEETITAQEGKDNLRFQCGFCDKIFQRKSSLQSHKNKTHSSMRTFKCTEPRCSFSGFRYFDLKRHCKITHEQKDKNYKCDLCSNGVYQTRSGLMRHKQNIHYAKTTKTNIDVEKDPLADNVSELEPKEIKLHNTAVRKNNTIIPLELIPQKEDTVTGSSSITKGVGEMVDKGFRYCCQFRNCGAIFKDVKGFLKHSTSHKSYKCKFCDQYFFVERELLLHEVRQHDADHTRAKCDQCDAIFLKEISLKHHIARKHVNSSLVCTIEGCTFTADTYPLFQSHVQSHTLLNWFQCKTCLKKFSTRYNFKEHQNKEKHEEEPLILDIGDDEYNFKRHQIKQKHEEDPLIVDKEGKETLVTPKRRPKRKKEAYLCDKCGHVSRTFKECEAHYKRNCLKENESPKTTCLCEECGKVFKHPVSLRSHMLYHKGIVLYRCPDCNKGFNIRGLFKQHVRIVHRKERPYLCSECGNGFNYEVSLKVHLASKHNIFRSNKLYNCDICKKKFVTSSSMNTHVQRFHTKEKRYVCKFKCGRTFASSSEIRNHEYTHTNEYPFNCEECGKGEPTVYKLKRHKKYNHALKKIRTEEELLAITKRMQKFATPIDLQKQQELKKLIIVMATNNQLGDMTSDNEQGDQQQQTQSISVLDDKTITISGQDNDEGVLHIQFVTEDDQEKPEDSLAQVIETDDISGSPPAIHITDTAHSPPVLQIPDTADSPPEIKILKTEVSEESDKLPNEVSELQIPDAFEEHFEEHTYAAETEELNELVYADEDIDLNNYQQLAIVNDAGEVLQYVLIDKADGILLEDEINII